MGCRWRTLTSEKGETRRETRVFYSGLIMGADDHAADLEF